MNRCPRLSIPVLGLVASLIPGGALAWQTPQDSPNVAYFWINAQESHSVFHGLLAENECGSLATCALWDEHRHVLDEDARRPYKAGIWLLRAYELSDSKPKIVLLSLGASPSNPLLPPPGTPFHAPPPCGPEQQCPEPGPGGDPVLPPDPSPPCGPEQQCPEPGPGGDPVLPPDPSPPCGPEQQCPEPGPGGDPVLPPDPSPPCGPEQQCPEPGPGGDPVLPPDPSPPCGPEQQCPEPGPHLMIEIERGHLIETRSLALEGIAYRVALEALSGQR